jgi:glycosyltransferase involved in cell wall biosynthesis
MAPRRGGSQIQLLDRLSAESQLRPVALLYPSGAGSSWVLERHHGAQHGYIPMPVRDRLADLVTEAADLVGTGMVHLKCLAGLAPDLAPELHARGLQVILSVHDFSLLCLRPHLLEQPAGRFCSLSTDQQRCRRCLAADGLATAADLAGRRAAGSAALAAAAAVVFPSRFLQSWYERWPGAEGRQLVIAPASRIRLRTAQPRPPRVHHIAFVGGIKQIKGGSLVPGIFEQVRTQVPDLSGIVLGEVEPKLAPALRRCLHLRVRGYYRAGDLVRQLQQHRVALAVLPSIVPESYCLVADECLHAGVPVIAFAHGAAGQRLHRLQAGITVPLAEVPLAEGAAGMARAVIAALNGQVPVVPADLRQLLPTPAGVAEQYLRLYRRLQP